jgi:para-nitrobenzyl esterase
MSPQSRGGVGSLFASWTFDKEMSEDCQLLNIWTPGLRDGVKRPVMVWLHGGDFSSLSGSPHSLDLALVFDNVAVSASMVGSGPEAQRLADQMSTAWLAFARNGRPDTAGLPAWPAYDTRRRATMVFDEQSRVIDDFRGEERVLLAGLKPPS